MAEGTTGTSTGAGSGAGTGTDGFGRLFDASEELRALKEAPFLSNKKEYAQLHRFVQAYAIVSHEFPGATQDEILNKILERADVYNLPKDKHSLSVLCAFGRVYSGGKEMATPKQVEYAYSEYVMKKRFPKKEEAEKKVKDAEKKIKECKADRKFYRRKMVGPVFGMIGVFAVGTVFTGGLVGLVGALAAGAITGVAATSFAGLAVLAGTFLGARFGFKLLKKAFKAAKNKYKLLHDDNNKSRETQLATEAQLNRDRSALNVLEGKIAKDNEAGNDLVLFGEYSALVAAETAAAATREGATTGREGVAEITGGSDEATAESAPEDTSEEDKKDESGDTTEDKEAAPPEVEDEAGLFEEDKKDKPGDTTEDKKDKSEGTTKGAKGEDKAGPAKETAGAGGGGDGGKGDDEADLERDKLKQVLYSRAEEFFNMARHPKGLKSKQAKELVKFIKEIDDPSIKPIVAETTIRDVMVSIAKDFQSRSEKNEEKLTAFCTDIYGSNELLDEINSELTRPFSEIEPYTVLRELTEEEKAERAKAAKNAEAVAAAESAKTEDEETKKKFGERFAEGVRAGGKKAVEAAKAGGKKVIEVTKAGGKKAVEAAKAGGKKVIEAAKAGAAKMRKKKQAEGQTEAVATEDSATTRRVLSQKQAEEETKQRREAEKARRAEFKKEQEREERRILDLARKGIKTDAAEELENKMGLETERVRVIDEIEKVIGQFNSMDVKPDAVQRLSALLIDLERPEIQEALKGTVYPDLVYAMAHEIVGDESHKRKGEGLLPKSYHDMLAKSVGGSISEESWARIYKSAGYKVVETQTILENDGPEQEPPTGGSGEQEPEETRTKPVEKGPAELALEQFVAENKGQKIGGLERGHRRIEYYERAIQEQELSKYRTDKGWSFRQAASDGKKEELKEYLNWLGNKTSPTAYIEQHGEKELFEQYRGLKAESEKERQDAAPMVEAEAESAPVQEHREATETAPESSGSGGGTIPPESTVGSRGMHTIKVKPPEKEVEVVEPDYDKWDDGKPDYKKITRRRVRENAGPRTSTAVRQFVRELKKNEPHLSKEEIEARKKEFADEYSTNRRILVDGARGLRADLKVEYKEQQAAEYVLSGKIDFDRMKKKDLERVILGSKHIDSMDLEARADMITAIARTKIYLESADGLVKFNDEQRAALDKELKRRVEYFGTMLPETLQEIQEEKTRIYAEQERQRQAQAEAESAPTGAGNVAEQTPVEPEAEGTQPEDTAERDAEPTPVEPEAEGTQPENTAERDAEPTPVEPEAEGTQPEDAAERAAEQTPVEPKEPEPEDAKTDEVVIPELPDDYHMWGQDWFEYLSQAKAYFKKPELWENSLTTEKIETIAREWCDKKIGALDESKRLKELQAKVRNGETLTQSEKEEAHKCLERMTSFAGVYADHTKHIKDVTMGFADAAYKLELDEPDGSKLVRGEWVAMNDKWLSLFFTDEYIFGDVKSDGASKRIDTFREKYQSGELSEEDIDDMLRVFEDCEKKHIDPMFRDTMLMSETELLSLVQEFVIDGKQADGTKIPRNLRKHFKEKIEELGEKQKRDYIADAEKRAMELEADRIIREKRAKANEAIEFALSDDFDVSKLDKKSLEKMVLVATYIDRVKDGEEKKKLIAVLGKAQDYISRDPNGKFDKKQKNALKSVIESGIVSRDTISEIEKERMAAYQEALEREREANAEKARREAEEKERREAEGKAKKKGKRTKVSPEEVSEAKGEQTNKGTTSGKQSHEDSSETGDERSM